MLTGYVKGMRMAKTDRIAIGPSLFLASGCGDAGCGKCRGQGSGEWSQQRQRFIAQSLSRGIADSIPKDSRQNFGASFRISTRNFGAYLLPLLLANLAILPMLKF
jgi:hypothetical protein